MLAFIDESGFPHPNDETLNPVLAAVCIPKDEIRNIMQRMYKIKMDIYGRYDVELKASGEKQLHGIYKLPSRLLC
ncbi:hypothetical protein EBB07_11985 [Paenibacillaceae bacterium]|nr:hypothetical protein EBB07_11985 [Paenibacillaceae bacterium]